MAQAQHRGSARATMFARWCAAWIILLGLSPLAVPFAVSEIQHVIGSQATAPRSAPARRNVFEVWEDDAVVGEVPGVPLATELAAMSSPCVIEGTETVMPRRPAAVRPLTPPIRIPLALRV